MTRQNGNIPRSVVIPDIDSLAHSSCGNTPKIYDEPADFNGMSERAFYTGNEIRNILELLDDDSAAELRPRLTQEVINQALSRPVAPEQLADLIRVFEEGLELLKMARHQGEVRARLGAVPRTDTNY